MSKFPQGIYMAEKYIDSYGNLLSLITVYVHNVNKFLIGLILCAGDDANLHGPGKRILPKM